MKSIAIVIIVCFSFVSFSSTQPAGSSTALPTPFLQNTAAQQSVMLVGTGSSVPLPLYRRWALEYNHRGPAIQMGYLPLGTTEGIRQVSHNVGDFGAGEAPLTDEERKAGLTELPVAVIAIVPIYYVPGVHEELRFSGELLAAIFMGDVKTWDAKEIARLNPGVTLPNLRIQVVYRPKGKGTNYVFTEFLSKTSSKFRGRIGTSVSPRWPTGVPAERSSDMADMVKREPGAIGYVELQYAIQDKIPYAYVLNRAGHFVKASAETIIAACREVEAPQWEKFSASLTNAPGNDSFPITSFTWVYFRPQALHTLRGKALGDLFNWMFSYGQQFAFQLGYSELPTPLLAKTKSRVASLQRGETE
jgi:phosphate transport system substrate-binding protein